MANSVTLIFDIASFSSVMVLIVLGLGVIASMMGIFNFAHGEFVLLGAYTVYLSAMERIVIRRFYASPIIAMLGTYAIGLVIRETVRGLLGGQYRSIAEPITGAFSIGGINFSIWRTIIIVATVAVLAASWWMLARTPFGLRIRGALENPMLARACGISTARLYGLTFAFGSALAGLAGALIVPLYQLSADIGIRFLVQAFLSVMLGGVGTFQGPVLGAGTVGVMASGLPWLVPPVLADPLVFLIALVIVKIRPQGLWSVVRT
jgi:branched-chain amino acid transport system permease protein